MTNNHKEFDPMAIRARTRLLPLAYKYTGSNFTGAFVSLEAMEKVDWAELKPKEIGVYISQPCIRFKPRLLCSRAQEIGLTLEDFRVGVCCQLIGDGSLPISRHDELDLGDVDICSIDKQLSLKVRNSSPVAIKFKLWFSGIIAEA